MNVINVLIRCANVIFLSLDRLVYQARLKWHIWEDGIWDILSMFAGDAKLGEAVDSSEGKEVLIGYNTGHLPVV